MAEHWTVSHAPPVMETVFVTGIEHRPNGATRVFVGQRGKGRFVLLSPEGTAAVEHAWNGGGHVCIQPSAIDGLPIFYEAAPATEKDGA